MRKILNMSAIFVLSSFAASQSQPQLNLMPMPASVQPGTGQLPITQSFSVGVTGFHDASLDREIQRFQTQLSRQTGMWFWPKRSSSPTLSIHADSAREAVQKLGEDESYELTVTDSPPSSPRQPRSASCAASRLFCSLSRSLPRVLPPPPSPSRISPASPGAA